jgi:DNA-binding transcriptional LysR family regulator
VDAKLAVDLNDVALLVRVVQTQSFSAAARERGVPVSSVSRRITRLETALGTRLLERTTRRLRLTDAGRDYFAHAERAVDDLAHGGARVRELSTEPRGRVRVASPIVFGTAVSNAIHGYLALHPHVSIELRLHDRSADLLAEGFDIAMIGGRPQEHTGDFIARELWRSTRKLLFASPRYLKARGAPERVEELAQHDCIATHASEGFATWALSAGRKKRNITILPRFLVNESSAAHRAALAGVGIAMLPEVISAADVRAKRLVRVLDGYEGEAGGVYLLYRAHRAITAAVRTCVDHFLTALPVTDPSRAPR